MFGAERPSALATVDAFSNVSAIGRDIVVDQTFHDRMVPRHSNDAGRVPAHVLFEADDRRESNHTEA